MMNIMNTDAAQGKPASSMSKHRGADLGTHSVRFLRDQRKGMKMKDSKTLLLEYLASIRDPERAAALFAEDGAFELPFMRSLGVEARHSGRRDIAAFLGQFLKLYPDVAFAPGDIRVLIETPDKTFAEYVTHMISAATGRRL